MPAGPAPPVRRPVTTGTRRLSRSCSPASAPTPHTGCRRRADVPQPPGDLRRGVRLPVGGDRGHLRPGQCLGDARGAAVRVHGPVVPSGLLGPETVEALELGRSPAVLRRGHRRRGRLGAGDGVGRGLRPRGLGGAFGGGRRLGLGLRPGRRCCGGVRVGLVLRSTRVGDLGGRVDGRRDARGDRAAGQFAVVRQRTHPAFEGRGVGLLVRVGQHGPRGDDGRGRLGPVEGRAVQGRGAAGGGAARARDAERLADRGLRADGRDAADECHGGGAPDEQGARRRSARRRRRSGVSSACRRVVGVVALGSGVLPGSGCAGFCGVLGHRFRWSAGWGAPPGPRRCRHAGGVGVHGASWGSREPGGPDGGVGPVRPPLGRRGAACSGEADTMTRQPGHRVQECWQDGPTAPW